MRRLQPVEQVIKDLVTKVILGSQLQGHCFDPWRRGKWAALPAEKQFALEQELESGKGRGGALIWKLGRTQAGQAKCGLVPGCKRVVGMGAP